MYISVMTFFMLLMWLTYQIHILKTKKKWFFQVCLCKVRFKLSSFAIVRRYPVQSDWNASYHVFFLLNSFLLTQNRKSLEILLLWLTGLPISFTIQHECQQWIIYSGLYCIASVRIGVFSSKFINSPVLAPGNFLWCHFLNGIYAERHFPYLMRTAGEWTLAQNFLWFLIPVSNDQRSTPVVVWKCLKRMRCQPYIVFVVSYHVRWVDFWYSWKCCYLKQLRIARPQVECFGEASWENHSSICI